MSNRTDTRRHLCVSLDLMVEVADPAALQTAALADLRSHELDAEERQAQINQIATDPTGATALRWLITPEDIIGLVDRIGAVKPVEAALEISESEGSLTPEGH